MFKKIFYMTSLSLGVFSCGVKAPELESMDMGAPLKQPTYQTRSFENFEAGLSDQEKVFKGSLILWHEDAAVSGLSQVITLSNEAKDFEVLYRKSVRALENVTNELSKLDIQKNLLKKKYL